VNSSNDRGRRAARHVGAVAWRLAVVLVALELVYLLLANVALKTSLVRKFAHSDDILVDYDSAYSVVPGRLVVRGLRVRVQDHNIQFLIAVEHGVLDVSLTELARKRFHALRVDADAVTYRMRHKLSHVGKEGPRVAAYPPIFGFADPPLFTGAPSKPIPDSEYDLWEVRCENITAHVKEIWILEYRYRGAGVARGNFHLRPARYYDVTPATLELDGGTLQLGDKVVASRADANIFIQVDGSEVRKLSGLQPFSHITSTVRGRFDGMDLAFINAYLRPHLGAAVNGQATTEFDLKLDHGSIAPQSRLVVRAEETAVGSGSLNVIGAPVFSLNGPEAAGGDSELGFRAERLDLGGKGEVRQRVHADHVDVRLGFTSKVYDPITVTSLRVAPLDVVAPDLAWLKRTLPMDVGISDLRGSARLTLEGERHADAPVRGRFALRVNDMAFALDDRASAPFDGTLTSDDVVAAPGDPPRVSTTLKLHVSRAAALLPLVSSSAFLRTVESKLLALDSLDVRAKIRTGEVTRLDVLDARSGAARVQGSLLFGKGRPTGALLLATPAANLGIRFAPSGTELKPLVHDDWLRGENASPSVGIGAKRGSSPQATD
jgi:hypothetical protein